MLGWQEQIDDEQRLWCMKVVQNWIHQTEECRCAHDEYQVEPKCWVSWFRRMSKGRNGQLRKLSNGRFIP